MALSPLRLDGQPLSIADVESVARQDRTVEIGPVAQARIRAAQDVVLARAAGAEPYYGINTGFGSLSRVRIAADDVSAMQHNILRSHASGVGEPLPRDIVRAMMVLCAASLSRGHSGVSLALVEMLATFLNRGLTPLVPSRGSVGASGDLAPLSHVAIALIGEGMVLNHGIRAPTLIALRTRGIEPLTLGPKEGLALINGTHFMAGAAALLLADLERVIDAAVFASALSIDACRATDAFLDDRLHAARRQQGQADVARRVRQLLDGSEVLPAHRANDPRVQDPYCLRALPQVLGAAVDAIGYVRHVVERELGAVTDNPLVFPSESPAPASGEGDILSGGNFHGMPLAIALDLVAIAMCHVAGISERRVNWLVSAADPQNPVPAYVSPQPGLHSGLMIAQYAAAACVNEMMTLATPASVGNVTTSAGIEDYNSMGATSAHKARRSIDLLVSVLAIEILTMTEAMEYQRPLKSGGAIERGIAAVREVVPRLVADRSPAPDIAQVERLIRAGAFALPSAS